mmetsp:Transcript_32716/g.58595  ORF Transcript_32716/g.58595 Transcript_32716/m.58595 type:complete len:219 (+) Transcript_32716:4822-5478(+)
MLSRVADNASAKGIIGKPKRYSAHILREPSLLGAPAQYQAKNLVAVDQAPHLDSTLAFLSLKRLPGVTVIVLALSRVKHQRGHLISIPTDLPRNNAAQVVLRHTQLEGTGLPLVSVPDAKMASVVAGPHQQPRSGPKVVSTRPACIFRGIVCHLSFAQLSHEFARIDVPSGDGAELGGDNQYLAIYSKHSRKWPSSPLRKVQLQSLLLNVHRPYMHFV